MDEAGRVEPQSSLERRSAAAGAAGAEDRGGEEPKTPKPTFGPSLVPPLGGQRSARQRFEILAPGPVRCSLEVT